MENKITPEQEYRMRESKDYANFAKKEKMLKDFLFFYGKLGVTRKNLMLWASTVTLDSMDDPVLKGEFEDEIERKSVIDFLLTLKKLGLDN